MPVDNTEPLSVYRAGPGYAGCLADMMLLASRAQEKRGFLDRILDAPPALVRRLLALLAMHPGQSSGRIAHTFVALVDGVCSGTLTARPGFDAALFPFAPQALRHVAPRAGFTPEAVAAILARQAAFQALLPRVRSLPGTWHIEYLAARRENRSAGVARGLMARLAAEAGDTGATALEVFCPEGAEHAERLLKVLGFVAVEKGLADQNGQRFALLRLTLP